MAREALIRVGGVAVLVGLALAGALAAAIAFGLPGGDEGPRDSLSGNALLATSRERLAVCVQAAEGAAVDVNVIPKRVEEALAVVAEDPDWPGSGLDFAPPTVVVGCPSAPFLLVSGRTSSGKPVGDPALQEVQEASEYRVFLFILPQPVVERLFGDGPVRVEPQEFLCDKGTCAEVTTGLYLTPEEVNNPQVLQQWLAKALGIEPLLPEQAEPEEVPKR